MLVVKGLPLGRIQKVLAFVFIAVMSVASAAAIETLAAEPSAAQTQSSTDRTGVAVRSIEYTPVTCSYGYYPDLRAVDYLNLSPSDYVLCPTRALFVNRNGYFPSWGYENNMSNDVGEVLVNPNGGCSSSPDTGPFWDFQIPCKSHDYCYDLRKAGFSGTVSDADCDQAFYFLMIAHCDDRILQQQCSNLALTYYSAVSLGGVVTNPDPAPVNLQSDMYPNKCPYFGSVVVTEEDCATVNEAVRFIPVGSGWFNIVPVTRGSGYCAWGPQAFATVQIDHCNIAGRPSSDKYWKPNGAFFSNIYVIKSAHTGQGVWDIYQSNPASGTPIIVWPEYQTSNQLWRLT